MRKLFIVFLFFILCSLPASLRAGSSLFDNASYSYGITSGSAMVDLGFGGEYLNSGASDANLKTGAFLMNLRVLYAATKYFHIGLEGIFGYGGMSGGALPYGREYESSNFYIKKDENYYKTFAVLLSSRVNMNPDYSDRFYIPFAFGYMQKDQTTEYTAYSYVLPGWEHEFKEEKMLAQGIYAYGGFGFEHDFNPGFLGGIEARYGVFRCGGDWVSSISALVKIGFKS